jgi:hypothetical protein
MRAGSGLVCILSGLREEVLREEEEENDDEGEEGQFGDE